MAGYRSAVGAGTGPGEEHVLDFTTGPRQGPPRRFFFYCARFPGSGRSAQASQASHDGASHSYDPRRARLPGFLSREITPLSQLPALEPSSPKTASASRLDALVFAASDKFQPELTADCHSRSLKSVQRNTRVGRIEQTIKCPTAGLHTDGHRRLGEAIFLHGGFDLIGEDLLDGLFLALFQNALFG